MSSHKEQVHEFERVRLKTAIITAKGSLQGAAKLLNMPISTLAAKLKKHPKVSERAKSMREKEIGHRGRGRPRLKDENRSKRAVAKAWRDAEGVYAVCARTLKLPTSTVKQLIERFELPVKSKKKKPAA